MKIVPIFGGGTYYKSATVTRQRRLNCYYENRPDQDKSKIAIYGTPGLQLIATVSTPLNKPLRAFLGTQTAIYAVAYNKFMQLSTTGAILYSYTLTTYVGLVSMVNSSTQGVLVDGGNGYVLSAGTMSPISMFPATGARTVTFCSGFFVAEQPGTQKFWVSNAFDGTTWNALAFASASSDSDNILAVDQLNGILLIYMQQGMEFWSNQGLSPQPFAPLISAANQLGLAAIFSRVHVNQTIIFLAQTQEGAVQFAQVVGYNVNIISDADIDELINSFTVTSDCIGLTYQVGQHKMAQFTFVTANRTLLYDTSTGLWSEAQTGTSEIPARHVANLSAYYNGYTYLSDYATNKVYKMSETQYTDNGVSILRELITRHVLSQFNRVRISLLYLDMETGVGLQTGQGNNPQVMLQISKDNGRKWSAERWRSLGAVGQYRNRVLWRRFGTSRDYVFRIRMTDPVKFVITEGAIKIAERQPLDKAG